MKWGGSLLDELGRVDDARLAVAGDWHSNIMWIQQVLSELRRLAPDVSTILHTGDFSILPEARGKRFLRAVDAACRENGIDRILVTPGNHEDWPRLDALFAARPGEAVRLSASVWLMPRGYRFSIHGRTFMSFGGAASLDAAYRRTRGTWWASEMPAPEEVAAAVAQGTSTSWSPTKRSWMAPPESKREFSRTLCTGTKPHLLTRDSHELSLHASGKE
jgi:hypothetical protein